VPAQRISTRLQHLKARLLPRNTCPPTPTSHHLAISKTQNRISHAPLPPANMANPWFGSDVAARANLATLREAVVQRPVIASKMSTALLTPLAAAQRISTRLQHLKARLLPRNTCPPTPTSHHLAISTTQNRISHAPLPPANMANPWFGSDVAAGFHLATLRAAVVQAAGHCPVCAAAMLMKHSVTATTAAVVWRRHVAELSRMSARSVRVGCSCACPRMAVFLYDCKRFFVMGARLVDATAGCGRVKAQPESALVDLTSSEPCRCDECWRQSSGGEERKSAGSARKNFQVQGSSLLVEMSLTVTSNTHVIPLQVHSWQSARGSAQLAPYNPRQRAHGLARARSSHEGQLCTRGHGAAYKAASVTA
jgi:hypothetical protein